MGDHVASQTLKGPWNQRAKVKYPLVFDGEGRTHRFDMPIRVTSGYPTDDRRGRPERQRVTSFRGPVTSNLKPRHIYLWRWLIAERFEFPEVVKIDKYGDNSGRILTDKGLYEFDSQHFGLFGYTLGYGSFHEYGEWDGSPSAGQASWIPRHPLDRIEPGQPIDHCLNLGVPEDKAGYGIANYALRTDVVKGEFNKKTGVWRGTPDGPPMGTLFVLSPEAASEARSALQSVPDSERDVDWYTAWYVVQALSEYGCVFGNTSAPTKTNPYLVTGMTEEARTPRAVSLINDALASATLLEAEPL